MYLVACQFDSRGEGATRVLTFGCVEAAGVKETDPREKQINQSHHCILTEFIFILIIHVVLPVVDPVRKVVVVSHTRISRCRLVV